MRNRRAIFSVFTSSLIAFAFVVVACKDEEPNTFDDAKLDSGVPDRVQGFQTDTGGGFEASTKVECKPALPSSFAATFTPPAKKDACTADQIKTYYEACLPNLGKQPCKDWLAANTDCGNCIEAPEAKGPVQIFRDRYYYTFNNAGCVALVQGKSGEDSCAKAYDTATNCRRAACDSCFSIEGAQFTDFTACQGLAAGSNACKGNEATSTERCENAKPGYKDPDGGAPQCFASPSTEDQKLVYARIASAFCLKP